MLFPDLVDVPVEVFGGYVSSIAPSDLPPGAAAIAQDVQFPQAGLRTRGGLLDFFGPNNPGIIPATAAINGLKSYVTPTLAQRLLAWDSFGNFYKENPQGIISLVAARPYINLFYESQTYFGREYQAFFNSLGGFDIPRQFDDTNWDRVSQAGPGAAPNATDEIAVLNITASPNGLSQPSSNNITSISESGNLVTAVITVADSAELVTAAQNALATTTLQVVIAGVATGGYNGTFQVATIQLGPGSSATVTLLNPTSGLGAVGAGGTLSFGVTLLVATVALTPNFFGNAFPGAGLPNVQVAGAGVTQYNGTWRVVGNGFAINTKNLYIIVTTLGLANSGNGTVTVVGSIVAGLHQVSVAFVTRQGFITQAAVPPFTWTAGGNRRAVISNIPTGPPTIVGTPYVTGRLLLFTPVITPPATTGSFYSLPQGSSQIPTGVMLIPDNTTTQVFIDFTDTILIAGFSANYLFTQLELGEMAFMLGYNSRLCWLGERNHQPNWVNLGFDGGFGVDGSGRTFPLGWTQDPASYTGGGSALIHALSVDWGDAYVITGDGVTAVRGKMTQNATVDYLNVPRIAANVTYGVRARIAKSANALTQGTLHINLNNASNITPGLAVASGLLTTNFQEFTAPLMVNPFGPIQLAQGVTLQVYADGTPTNGGQFIVDSIEIFPITTPFNYSTARFSHAFNPESYDGSTGQIQVRPGDGQQLRAGFPLRNNLYLAKDHYLCYVTDDGVNEPSSWAVNEVSATVGICGPNAVDWNEEWAAFAERSGLYLCWGSDPVKITPEIQTDGANQGRICWESINWQYGHTIWVRIWKSRKMILVGAPVNGATTPNVVFMMDYRWLDNAQDIASSPLVTYSAFTGKALAHGRGRRWALWNITANSMTFAERSDGTSQPFYGNGTGNGIIYQQSDSTTTDNGAAILGLWQGYGLPSHIEEQQYQLSAHRKLCGYLKFRAIGNGTLNLSVSTAQRTTLLRGYTLSANPPADGGRPVNCHGDRFFLTVGTTGPGMWFQLEQLIACVKKDSAIPVRGLSV